MSTRTDTLDVLDINKGFVLAVELAINNSNFRAGNNSLLNRHFYCLLHRIDLGHTRVPLKMTMLHQYCSICMSTLFFVLATLHTPGKGPHTNIPTFMTPFASIRFCAACAHLAVLMSSLAAPEKRCGWVFKGFSCISVLGTMSVFGQRMPLRYCSLSLFCIFTVPSVFLSTDAYFTHTLFFSSPLDIWYYLS